MFFRILPLLLFIVSCSNKPVLDWQQHVSYKMTIDVDADNGSYSGLQELVYTNNSPDTISRVFYHLYFNAFKPGSEMQVRASQITDDRRKISEKILALDESDYGEVRVIDLFQEGVLLSLKSQETILEASLAKPLLPGEATKLVMRFEVDVPKEVRRAGKDNKDGVAFSMAQWYPKLSEYDDQGWHANAYIGREFYGVWGDFDVTINIDKDYTVAATGYLKNPGEIGHGYAELIEPYVSEKLSWNFYAPNVHDFSWAADTNYVHDIVSVPEGPVMHFFYKNEDPYVENWKKVQPYAVRFMEYFSKNIGVYPYKQYSVIHAGDGGMEYAMSTFIGGVRDFESLAGVISHEIAHTWFQFLLATNESKHAWMDEGFTSYISDHAENAVFEKELKLPNKRAYRDYFRVVASGAEEPLTTHADRFSSSRNYGTSSYDKGSVFLSQLGYVVGEGVLLKVLKEYYSNYVFKHPDPEKFIRVAEKVSGQELDWYLMDWAQTTKTIDYAVLKADVVLSQNTLFCDPLLDVGLEHEHSRVYLKREGEMALPSDVLIETSAGLVKNYHIPLLMSRGHKPINKGVRLLKSWSWANKNYSFEVCIKKEAIAKVLIDPSGKSADVNRNNNSI
jgi:hypothetical protein|tara:strand:+ start:867 stop:2720 length:1854 start_codon:yes stop_codon:yes gene_type:complete